MRSFLEPFGIAAIEAATQAVSRPEQIRCGLGMSLLRCPQHHHPSAKRVQDDGKIDQLLQA